MPTNSAPTALQKLHLFISVISALDVSAALKTTCKLFSIYSEGLWAEGGGKREQEKDVPHSYGHTFEYERENEILLMEKTFF